jgi:hypothetical protein
MGCGCGTDKPIIVAKDTSMENHKKEPSLTP